MKKKEIERLTNFRLSARWAMEWSAQLQDYYNLTADRALTIAWRLYRLLSALGDRKVRFSYYTDFYQMQDGVEYIEASLRVAVGTLNPDLDEGLRNWCEKGTVKRKNPFVCKYWDIERQQWRSFRVVCLNKIEEVL